METARTSASGRVLACPELVTSIFGTFSVAHFLQDYRRNESMDDYLDYREQNSATLASCARVCRSLSGHALDILWHTLDGFLPFLGLFSAFDMVGELYMFTGGLDKDWARFQSYASRVRSLRYRPSEQLVAVHDSVWALLARASKGLGLLPNIKRLWTTELTLSDIAPITLLFAPSIREVHLSFSENLEDYLSQEALSPIASALFDELVQTAGSQLEDLCLFNRFPLAPARVFSLDGCRNLRHVVLADPGYTILDASGVRFLEQLGPLKSLAVGVRLDDCQTPADLLLSRGFPEVETLWLYGAAPDVTKFVLAARLTAISEFEVTITGSTDMAALQECLSDVGARLPRHLFRLHLKVKELSPPSPILGDVLRPIYALNGLRSLECDLAAQTPRISDDDLQELAQAWPQLGWLAIPTGSPPNTRRLSLLRRPTFRGLAELARHCPRLRTITLPSLEISPLPAPETLPVLDRWTMWLKVSFLPTHDARQYYDMAVLLDRLFPRLEKFEVSNEAQGVGGSKVFRYLEAMQTGRKHDRLLRQVPESEEVEPDEEEDGQEEDEDARSHL